MALVSVLLPTYLTDFDKDMDGRDQNLLDLPIPTGLYLPFGSAHRLHPEASFQTTAPGNLDQPGAWNLRLVYGLRPPLEDLL
ncbi:hypothetical protein N7516_010688 [Penicillium verrucosum]|uniref:uncharacterized protein n=1 Tax=Penicillium verrucosum TaxID=60171 RepID=UPI0025450B4A|nr:uncharacterized protein N7516_010688 [Penicillium verrucosum]KAJ5922985.1 hypothetical protein N7516_010688 [Penicillium verrucosum]